MTTTNFFSEIASILTDKDIRLELTLKMDDGQIVCTTHIKRKVDTKEKNKETPYVPPLVFRGKPDELDREALGRLLQPVDKVEAHFSTMEELDEAIKQAEEAKKAKASGKSTTAKPAEDKKQKESDKLVKEAEELLEAGDVVKARESLNKAIKAKQTPDTKKLTPKVEKGEKADAKAREALEQADKQLYGVALKTIKEAGKLMVTNTVKEAEKTIREKAGLGETTGLFAS